MVKPSDETCKLSVITLHHLEPVGPMYMFLIIVMIFVTLLHI